MELNINIVGLTHNDVKNNVLEYALSASDKLLQLIPDKQNIYDPLAVKAYEGKLFFGYVAVQDLEDVRAALIASHRAMLYARCNGYSTKEDGMSGLYLKATAWVDIEEEELREAYGKIYDDTIFDNWHYSGPMFSIDRLARIEDCTTILETTLKDLYHMEDIDQDYLQMFRENADEQLTNFMASHYFDYSREMTRARKHLLTLLTLMDDKKLQSQRETLLSELGYITSSSHREKVARCFFIDTPITLLGTNVGVYDYSDRLDEIEQELKAFPFDMYRKFIADPLDFLREIYYKHVPRHQMQQLLSGIILMIMHHHVDGVKRWGKNNDEVALEEMKTLRRLQHPLDDKTDLARTREQAEQCIRKMALLYNPRTFKYLIQSQADWYAVFRVLADRRLFETDDHKGFAEYLSQVFDKDVLPTTSLHKGPVSALPMGLSEELKPRPHIPVCKRKDLGQASEPIFDKTPAERWGQLSDEDVAGIQKAKYQRYCNIVETFLKLMEEEH